MNLSRRSLLSFSIVGAASIAAVACGSDSATAPSVPAVDVSAAVSAMTSGGASAIPSSGLGTLGATTPLPSGASITAADCAYSATSGAFVCPAHSAGGVTYNVSFWLYDASGAPLTSLTSTGIASIRAVTDFSGTRTISVGSRTTTDTESGHADMTLSGLLTANRVLNGTSTVHEDFVFSGSTQHNVSTITGTTTNVVTPANGSTKWPTSGTIALAITGGAGDGIASGASLQSTITFSGNVATMVLSMNGTVLDTCLIDEVTNAVSCS